MILEYEKYPAVRHDESLCACTPVTYKSLTHCQSHQSRLSQVVMEEPCLSRYYRMRVSIPVYMPVRNNAGKPLLAPNTLMLAHANLHVSVRSSTWVSRKYVPCVWEIVRAEVRIQYSLSSVLIGAHFKIIDGNDEELPFFLYWSRIALTTQDWWFVPEKYVEVYFNQAEFKT